MKNKLFLSLSILTAAFSTVSAVTPEQQEIINTQAIAAYHRRCNPTRLDKAQSAVVDFGTSAKDKAVIVGAYLADTRAAKAIGSVATSTKNGVVAAGTFAKSNTWDKELFGYTNGGKYATSVVGLAAVAGVSYAAYKKGFFGKAKAKTVKSTVQAQPTTKAVAPVATPVQAKKAKHAKGKHCKNGKCGRRK